LPPPVFFDRGVPEVLAWARILGVGVQPHHLAAVAGCRYSPKVFVTEPWPEIYATDAERRETFEQAARSYKPTIAAYVEAGYKLCIVPKATVQERVEFVLRHANSDA
jgi:predicted ATPase